jgi:signal transduction histidine kinase
VLAARDIAFGKSAPARSAFFPAFVSAVNYSTLILASALGLSAGFAVGRRIDRRRPAAAKEVSQAATEVSHSAAAHDALQERVSGLSSLSTHQQQQSEAEKSQFARMLHDELGGLLVATKMDIVWLKRKLNGTDADIRTHWERALQSLEQALASKSRMIEALRPTLLDNLGLVPALRWLTEESARSSGMHMEQRFPSDPLPTLGPQSIALFRLVQEALSNVLRHARASKVIIEIANEKDCLVLGIRDDGIGISPEHLRSIESHGLAAMRLRIQSLQGELIIGPNATGQGSHVTARVPWRSIRAAEPLSDADQIYAGRL